MEPPTWPPELDTTVSLHSLLFHEIACRVSAKTPSPVTLAICTDKLHVVPTAKAPFSRQNAPGKGARQAIHKSSGFQVHPLCRACSNCSHAALKTPNTQKANDGASLAVKQVCMHQSRNAEPDVTAVALVP